MINTFKRPRRLPRPDNLFHRPYPDSFHRRQPKPDMLPLAITVLRFLFGRTGRFPLFLLRRVLLVINDRKIGKTLIDVRRQNIDPHLPAFVNIFGHLLRRSHFKRQQRRHELRRIMRLEIRRLKCQNRILAGVALVESIAPEPLDQLKNFLGLLFGNPFRKASGQKGILLGLNDAVFLLADRLDQPVRPRQRQVPQPVQDLHHLLLIHHDPVGFLEHLFHDRVRQRPALSVLAAVIIRNQRHRPRPVERIGRNQIFNPVRPHILQQIPHPVRFKLEHALRPAFRKKLQRLRIRQVDFIRLDVHPLAQLHQLPRPLYRRKRPQPQKIHLQQPDLLHRRAVILGDDFLRIRRLIQRQKIRQRLIRHHHARRMNRSMTRQPFQPFTDVDYILYFRVLFAPFLELGFLLQRHLQRNPQRIGYQLRQLIRLAQRHIQHPADIPDHRPRLHRPEGYDLRHLPVFLPHIINHLRPPVLADVHVNIGHLTPLRVHEPLEQQSVTQRVHIRYPQRITHHRAHPAAARPARNPLLPRIMHEIPHDQEITGKSFAPDYIQFMVEPVLDLLRNPRIFLLQALQA
ncbi:MAG: hypothetical protein BWY71_00651 [Planctomycetes bacterium ADurb.Bin412]|nr:MAG: hypothetical protein BWY71_00651 [Planctomycetes bacterium ADurb.Bin412]